MKQRNREKTPPSITLTAASSFEKELLEHTPHGPHALCEYAKRVSSILKETSMCSDLRATLQRLAKESITSAYSHQLAEVEIEMKHSYQMGKRKRDALSNTVASKHGVVTASMVRAKKQKRDVDEVEKAQQALHAAEARVKREGKKRWKPIIDDLKKAVKERNKQLGNVRKLMKHVNKDICSRITK